MISLISYISVFQGGKLFPFPSEVISPTRWYQAYALRLTIWGTPNSILSLRPTTSTAMEDAEEDNKEWLMGFLVMMRCPRDYTNLQIFFQFP